MAYLPDTTMEEFLIDCPVCYGALRDPCWETLQITIQWMSDGILGDAEIHPTFAII